MLAHTRVGGGGSVVVKRVHAKHYLSCVYNKQPLAPLASGRSIRASKARRFI